jgi:hypothetical protein
MSKPLSRDGSLLEEARVKRGRDEAVPFCGCRVGNGGRSPLRSATMRPVRRNSCHGGEDGVARRDGGAHTKVAGRASLPSTGSIAWQHSGELRGSAFAARCAPLYRYQRNDTEHRRRHQIIVRRQRIAGLRRLSDRFGQSTSTGENSRWRTRREISPALI